MSSQHPCFVSIEVGVFYCPPSSVHSVLSVMLNSVDYVTEVLEEKRIDKMHKLSEEDYKAYMQCVKDGLEPAMCHLYIW